MATTWRKVRSLRGLVVDIENKASTYGGGDYTHPKVTALACMFLGQKRPASWALDRTDLSTMRRNAEAFRAKWDAADFVVGHNIRRHDQKLLDGLYTSLDIPLLQRKRMVDTYLDQPKMQGLSRSLENLAYRWGCPMQKMHLSESEWEKAYDGIPEYVDLMRRRCASDVQINAWLYDELLRRDLLKWRS